MSPLCYSSNTVFSHDHYSVVAVSFHLILTRDGLQPAIGPKREKKNKYPKISARTLVIGV